MQVPASERLLEFSPRPVTPPEAARLDVSNLLLWFGAMGAPVSWAIHLMVVYPFVELACRWGSGAPLYAASAVLFGSAALAGLVSWRYVRYMRGHNGATVPRRVRFMARAGLYASVLFMLAILAGTLPVVFDDPCQLQGGPRGRTVLPHL